jgi:hypothetical protein
MKTPRWLARPKHDEEDNARYTVEICDVRGTPLLGPIEIQDLWTILKYGGYNSIWTTEGIFGGGVYGQGLTMTLTKYMGEAKQTVSIQL